MSDIQVPTCFSGTITALPPISSCMDGATHQLHTITPNPVRLKATTVEAKKALDEFVDTKTVVSVCGNWAWGPECSHLVVPEKTKIFIDTRSYATNKKCSYDGTPQSRDSDCQK